MLLSLTTRLLSLFPPGRRFLKAFWDLQNAVNRLETNAANSAARGGLDDAAARLDDAAAREVQTAAAAHLPLLLGAVSLTEDSIEVHGNFLAPEGPAGDLTFFINGRPFDEVAYPLDNPDLQMRFVHVRKAASFRARADRAASEVNGVEFFRIDVSSSGIFMPQSWRQTMWIRNPDRECFPFPPAENIRRVIGDDNHARFALGGSLIVKNIAAFLSERGRDMKDFSHILDWGCGAGRVTRYLLTETAGEICGADIDADNIEWCRMNLQPAEFVQLPLSPPTPLPAGHFDLVIGISVLTHLTESMQFAWLDELRRVTRPGALLFLSVTGPTQFAYIGFPPASVRRIQEEGFVDLRRDAALEGHVADTEYYRSSFHSRAYILDRWSQYFDVLAIEHAIAALQDFVVLRRRAD